jgi:hypothetical protein
MNMAEAFAVFTATAAAAAIGLAATAHADKGASFQAPGGNVACDMGGQVTAPRVRSLMRSPSGRAAGPTVRSAAPPRMGSSTGPVRRWILSKPNGWGRCHVNSRWAPRNPSHGAPSAGITARVTTSASP